MTKTNEYQSFMRIAHEAQRKRYPVQLPLWQDSHRAIPTDFVKSALFTARHDRDAEDVQRRIIASAEGIVLDYSGRLLNQLHARVWEGLMDGCRRASSNQFGFRGQSFAKRLSASGSAGKSQRDQLRLALKHLARANISVLHVLTGVTIEGSMISLTRSADDRYIVSVPAGIVTLFHESRVLIDPALDLKISGRLAQWLHRYFAATAKPVPLAELQRLSDSQTKSRRRFRQAVATSLDELARHEVLRAWEIDPAGVVHVEPTHAPHPITSASGGGILGTLSR